MGRRKSKKNRRLKKIFALITTLLFSAVISFFLIRAGFFANIQSFLVTSSMTTLSHKYIANVAASDSQIKDIMRENRVDENATSSESKKDDIVIEDKSDNSIELVDIKGKGYVGHMLIVSNPRSIILGTSKNLGNYGEKLNDMINRYGGIGGINAGGFEDREGKGNGGIPTGIVIENYEIKYIDTSLKTFSLVGFDKDGFLQLGRYTLDEIKKKNIKYAVNFKPFLIVNGVPSKIYGNGGWGIAPRTVIGQRKDGTVLLLVVDGRQVSSVGASIKDIQDIMLEYGAYNASNLDGGSSTVMYYQNRLINSPSSKHGERPLPNAFIIMK
ncbi:hypothetical protein Q428_12125 [Fervidicella metallireducens AeB]|uniref:Phosphodiester glycosidase domain-containing protein n=1 Tax=Fervidicella metallireducens AeB TaxID=1403537 RepID=A0A017RUU0_9CLOT|nr:phosphodiester glycosidase family protein [Fervidicella metallireducens]EYE87655.1 hypothetical protein Q428_12125 [Fervidicella metallireducens AeB]